MVDDWLIDGTLIDEFNMLIDGWHILVIVYGWMNAWWLNYVWSVDLSSWPQFNASVITWPRSLQVPPEAQEVYGMVDTYRTWTSQWGPPSGDMPPMDAWHILASLLTHHCWEKSRIPSLLWSRPWPMFIMADSPGIWDYFSGQTLDISRSLIGEDQACLMANNGA